MYFKKLIEEVIAEIPNKSFNADGICDFTSSFRVMRNDENEDFYYMFVEAFGIKVRFANDVAIEIKDASYAGQKVDYDKWQGCVIESIKNSLAPFLKPEDFYIN